MRRRTESAIKLSEPRLFLRQHRARTAVGLEDLADALVDVAVNSTFPTEQMRQLGMPKDGLASTVDLGGDRIDDPRHLD